MSAQRIPSSQSPKLFSELGGGSSNGAVGSPSQMKSPMKKRHMDSAGSVPSGSGDMFNFSRVLSAADGGTPNSPSRGQNVASDSTLYNIDFQHLQAFTVPGIELTEEISMKPGRASKGSVPQIMPFPEYLRRNTSEVADGENYEKLGLRTGADVVEYYGHHTSGAEVKVVFLNRPPPSKNFQPYLLNVVSRTATNPEYFTMSASGVVRVVKKPDGSLAAPSQFTPLGEWWRQATMFSMLRQLPFFKHYYVAKTYDRWDSNVRFRKFSFIRARMQRSLFWGMKTFCLTLLEVGRLCNEISTFLSVKVLRDSAQMSSTIEEFSQRQELQRQQASKHFETSIDRIQSLLEKVSEEVCAKVRPNDDGVLPLEAEASSIVQGKRGEKGKSIQQMRLENLARKKALEVAYFEVHMLKAFIRLADYMVVEAVFASLLASTQEISQQITKSRKEGIIGVSVRLEFNPAVVVVEPSAESVMESMRHSVDSIVQNISSVPRILFMPCFKTHFSKSEPCGGLSIPDIVADSVHLAASLSEIKTCVYKNYSDACDYAKTFENLRPILAYCTSFDSESYRDMDLITNARKVKKELTQLKTWGNEIERAKMKHPCGMYEIKSDALKEDVGVARSRCLAEVKEAVHSSARDSALRVLDDLKSKKKLLEQKPATLKDFATFVQEKNGIEEGLRDTLTNAATVEEIYKLIQQFDVKISTSESVKVDELRETAAKFQDFLGTASTEVGAKMSAMQVVLSDNVNQLNQEIQDVFNDLKVGMSINASHSSDDVLHYLDTITENLNASNDQATTFNEYASLFKAAPFDCSLVQTALEFHAERLELWTALHEWEGIESKWVGSPWSSLNPEDMSREVAVRLKEAVRMWKRNEDDEVAQKLKKNIETWRTRMPCFVDLGNPALKARHWKQIFDKIGRPVQESFTLQDILDWNFVSIKDFIADISGVASGEYALELQLAGIEKVWASLAFLVAPYREYKDVFIVAGIDEISATLEDNQAALQTMLASRFVLGIRDRVEDWDKKLSLVSETMDEWLTCQRSWMYLESIFGAPDIQKQLPAETTKFLRIDQQWKDTMKKTNKRPIIIEAACSLTLLKMFQDANVILEEIQKSLEDYLETKRVGFPRFYFLSNDELLEILSQTRDPRAVRPHLRKCFDCMSSVDFVTSGDEVSIALMESPENERVPLSQNVPCVGNVEFWMVKLENMMRKTGYDQMLLSLQAYSEETREAWFFEWPASMILTVDQIFWQKGVTKSLMDISAGKDKGALVNFKSFSINQIGRMVNVVRGQLTPMQRGNMCNLIVIDVHARDVVDRMIRENCGAITDFAWMCQLRYYWDSVPEDQKSKTKRHMDDNVSTDCYVRQTNASFLYGYEYLGVVPRLVITPLTDKCFMTLTGALSLILGGAPAGPAGTGKTESVKDLGKALAQICVVFNCSDGLDFKMMGRFFSGLSQAGAWACFDEFNRIDIEVLSVIAQQIMTIQNALKLGHPRVVFEGRDIAVNPQYGVFITMNPGYAGRTELPDNLKALFRPMAMMVPDYALIAEISLFSEGFQSAKDLARKMVAMYRLASEQLSSQDHYDFGMRAVKSVLVMAGQLKRSSPDVDEDITLVRAMRDSNVPKFLADDIPLFTAIIKDLFPGLVVPIIEHTRLVKQIHDELLNQNKQIVHPVVAKTIQLYETMNVRHGVMLVGVTLAAKTTCSRTLADAMTSIHKQCTDEGVPPLYQPVNRFVLNPKSITMGQLYGEMNLATNEWQDGLISTLVREAVANADDSKKWIMCDGPVDAIWIESMNTVLDDNKTLCLNNGERIKLPKTMSMVFEVNDLAVASPATVSRCGMVYLEPVYLGWRAIAKSWAEQKVDVRYPGLACGDSLFKFLDSTVDGALKFVRANCRENVATVDFNLVTSTLNLLDSFLSETRGITTDNITDLLRPIFGFCFVWGFGGNLHDGSLKKFDEFARSALDSVTQFPFGGTVYDFFVDVKTSRFVPWSGIIKSFNYSRDLPFFDLVVPTVDMTRVKFLADYLISGGHNILVTGNSGVGKTVMILDYLANAGDSYSSATKNFSAQTSAANLQAFLEEKLEKLRKNLLGPVSGKRMLFFIDDLNMPVKETYGAQPPIELLRQVINVEDDKQGGFYDRKKVGLFKRVKDTQFLASCCPPGGGRQEVTARYLRHFNFINVVDLSPESMKTIFVAITKGFLGNFTSQQKALAEPVVDSSIFLYQKIVKELLPTPAKSHYTFNLRDLAKVIQGMLMTEASKIKETDALIRLWTHECARVFRDRLIDDQDKTWFDDVIKNCLQQYFNVDMAVDDFSTIMFGDFNNKQGDKSYVEMTDIERCNKVLSDAAEDYALVNNKPMNLVFFRDAIAHVSRVSRVLRQPRGNVLLVGVGGSGRQSLARLASHISEYKIFQIELSRGYGPNEFHEDLKKMLSNAGVKAAATVFLFSDTQIVKESFLEDINNVLNAGEVPDLFGKDEIDGIVESVRKKAKEAGKPQTRDGIYSYFVQLCRENLHVCLTMSPVGDAFRTRLRMFPSLVNCCTIDWYTEWPEDALIGVATRFLQGVDLGSEEMLANVAKMCSVIHASVSAISKRFLSELRRYNYTTPTSYLELISMYLTMLKEAKEKVTFSINRYQGGVDKLVTTGEMVTSLKADLLKLQPVLEQAAIDTAKLLEEVTVDKGKAEEVQIMVAAESVKVNEIAAQANAIKIDAQADLDEALPAFEGAVKALKALSKNDITEIKSFAKPPPLVQTVLEAVCILKGAKPTWDDAKKIMSDSSFLSSLETYDKDNIPPKVIKAIQAYITNPDFTPDAVEKVSKAAKSLCMWVRAMDTYARIAKNVEPKRQALQAAEKQVAEMNALLAEKTGELRKVQERVAALEEKLNTTLRQKEALQKQSDETTARLGRAEELMGGLSGEKIRWDAELVQLDRDRQNLIGNVIIASGSIAYTGAFNSMYRQQLIDSWVTTCLGAGIAADPKFSLQRVVGDPVAIQEWGLQGLPSDKVSIDNGIIMKRSRRWPLLIDPQTQANRWIRNMERPNHMQVIKLTEATYLRTLENSIRVGNPVLLENVEEKLDPALEPILLKQVFKQAGRMLIRLGDTDVDYSPDFRFYVTTKLPNPHYSPEVQVKVTIVNFTVTPKGLEDQLLTQVVGFERPELEEEKNRLILQISTGMKQLKEIEDKILHMLANASGNILDDEVLIATLAASKTTSAAVNAQVAQAETTKQNIDVACEGYRPVATRGSIMYFVIADMGAIDPMYQYSLQFFTKLFTMCMEKSERSSELQVRVDTLIRVCTMDIYLNICRGLFEKDKKLFSFLIAIQVMRSSGAISESQWSFFLNRGGMYDEATLPSNPCDDFLSQDQWGALNLLAALPGMSEIPGIFDDNWKPWMECTRPDLESVPSIESKLTNFQKLLVIRTLREDKIVASVTTFIMKELGKQFIESPPFDLRVSFTDSSPTIPIIFVLSPGADPMQYLLNLATDMGVRDRLRAISLGQGQGPIAQKQIEAARTAGDWVCLQNCHLAASWMPELERILEAQSQMKLNTDFRLWLTSMPSKAFPVSVLQNGIKITNEPPKGLRANIKRTYEDMTEKYYTSSSKHLPWQKMLFGLAFFHAACQERRKFGPLGWNISYEWNASDLSTAQENIRRYLEEQEQIPFETLRYVVGEVNYGGRITDYLDQRSARCILSQYFCPEALEDAYRYTKDGVYYPPPVGDIASVREFVDKLPLQDSPEVFGLHPNASITFDKKETAYLIDTIISAQPRTGGSSDGKRPEDVVAEMAVDIQSKLPKLLSREGSHELTFASADGVMNSLGTFLLIEMGKFNKLLAKMQRTLSEIQRAIKGFVVMSSELEAMFNSFLLQKVPSVWTSVSYLSQKPLASWFKDMLARIEFMSNWLANGPPAAFWMSAFFFPQGFMTAALQTHARATQIAIDTLDFRTEVSKAA
jgi:dynein heavy chain